MQSQIGVFKNRDKYLVRSAEILRSLDDFIKEILSISHMDIAGEKMRKSINLSNILKSAVYDNQTLMDARSTKIEIDISSAVIIFGDAVLLKKAFSNIISNAAAYSPKGGKVTVGLRKIEEKQSLRSRIAVFTSQKKIFSISLRRFTAQIKVKTV